MNDKKVVTKFTFELYKNKGRNFFANLDCYFNEYGILINYNWQFKKGTEIDLYHTKSWHKTENNKGNKNWETRENLFQLLWAGEIKQKSRNRVSDTKNYTFLNEGDLFKLNWFFNNNYNSTLKNISSIFTGSNPSGSYKNPESSEIKCNNEKFKNNLIMLLDILSIKKHERLSVQNITKEYKLLERNSEEFYSFISRTESWVFLFDFIRVIEMVKEKGMDNQNEKEKIKDMKRKVEKHKTEFYKITEITENYAKKLRIEASKQKNNIKLFVNEKDAIKEVAHIFPVYKIKEEAISFINKKLKEGEKFENHQKEWINILNQIKDKNNLFTLTPTIHSVYDDKRFYWDPEKGEIKKIKNIDISTMKEIESLKIDRNDLNHIRPYLQKYKKLISRELLISKKV